MKLRSNKKGFTLVEMLIVIAIIGMMSTLAVTGYTSYRKQVLLDLTVDNFISQLNQMRSRASYGEGNGSCYGIYFANEAGVFTPKSFEQEFVGKKVWDDTASDADAGWKYQGCLEPDAADASIFSSLEGWDEQVVIKNIDGVGGDFFLQALPPEGKLMSNLGPVELNIVIGYQGDVDPQNERSMVIDIAHGKFNRIQNTENLIDENAPI